MDRGFGVVGRRNVLRLDFGFGVGGRNVFILGLAVAVTMNPFLVMDSGLDVIDDIAGLNFKSNGLADESLDEDLRVSTATKSPSEQL